MSWFNKDELERAAQVIRSDERAVAGLEAKLREIGPAWNEQQNDCELLVSMIMGHMDTYDRGVCESFWAERKASLRQRLKEGIAKRDALTGSLPGEIFESKARITRRKSVLANGFRSWADSVKERVAEPLRTELSEARNLCKQSLDVEQIVQLITSFSERVSEEHQGVNIPLLDWRCLARQVEAV